MANFTSPASAASKALRDYLVDRAVRDRQSLLDGILVSDRQRAIQLQDQERQRQARLDAQSAEDRSRRIANDDREYTDTQARQAVLDARYEAEQRQRGLDREDAAANRYLDTERDYYEAEQKRKFDAAEGAKERASQERRAVAGRTNADRPTQGQLTADTFYQRALDASEVLEDVEGSVSQFNRYVPNFLLSEDGQAYQQAQRQWTEAYLRKDSGAAIGKEEFDNAARAYFIAPGDSAATVKRKARARAKIQESLAHQGSGNSGGNGSGNIKPMPSHSTTRRIGRFEVVEE